MEGSESLIERSLSNGDVYVGTFNGTLLHGKGKCTWSDGTIYEGDWKEGKMTGKGHIIWSSGANYKGDFSGGYLHGFGTFSSPDGSIYSGVWRMNIHHGFGKKQYSNSDVYEGSWKEGVLEGNGRYVWNSGNSYVGNWKGGTMCGKGVMKWVNGDLYCGFWLNGLRHGSGVYRFADGGYYFGTWSKGLKDGKGIFYPAGSKSPTLDKWYRSLTIDIEGERYSSHSSSRSHQSNKRQVNRSLSEKTLAKGTSKSSSKKSHRDLVIDEDWSILDPSKETLSCDSSGRLSHDSDESQQEVQDKNGLAYEREYMQGVLKKERIRKYEELMPKSKQLNKFTIKETRKKSCVDDSRSRQSYYLMLNLQLGIRYTVGKITPVPRREVRDSDFGERARIRMYFPRKGSQLTPPHYSIDFHWKDYCPMVFRNLREMFKIDAAEYMMSICGDDGLRELSSPGKSGSLFYLSQDDRFVIKTLNKSELKVLLKMLQKYYNHVGEHENTLITKFFGLHRIALKRGRKVRFVVMGNMFCTELPIHRRYDLKGSTYGRCSNEDKIEGCTTLKDLDLSYEFHMDKLLRESLFKQLSLDCAFLESQHIIDYSLLLGLHFRAPEQLKAFLGPPSIMHRENSPTSDGAVTSNEEPMIPPKSLLLVTHEPASVNTAPGPHIRGSTLKAFSLGDKEVDLLLPGTARFRVQLGVNMPAQATHKLEQDGVDSGEVELLEVYDVVIYMGIIDILQDYNLRKKLEHAYKAWRFDPLSISVVEPTLYATRFIKFLGKVFHDLTS